MEKTWNACDAKPHSSVQEWSRGPLFPAIIFRTERYSAFPDYSEWIQRPGDSSLNVTSGAYVAQRAAFYDQPLEQRLESKWWSVILDGEVEEGLATYDEAEQCARGMLAQRAARAVA